MAKKQTTPKPAKKKLDVRHARIRDLAPRKTDIVGGGFGGGGGFSGFTGKKNT